MDRVTIVNMAAGLLGDISGSKRMTAFTRAGCNGNTVPLVAMDFYESAKKRMLASREWSGTRKIAALSASADAAILSGKWDYKYAKPPDCWVLLKVVDDSDNEYPYEVVVEEDANHKNVLWVYCNEADVYAKYIIDAGEETYLPGMDRLHAIYLAEDIATTVIGEPAKAAILMDRLRGMEAECMGLGLKEGYVESEAGTDEYVNLF